MSAPASPPDLELLTESPSDQTGRRPLLFVHGAYVGARCWAEHFLPYFADHGYPAHAVSLRGHGESGGRLLSAGIADYVTDVRRVVQRFDVPPVLVGHSMGGVVVQRYRKRYGASPAALLASLPPQGIAGLALSFALRDPVTWAQFGLLQTNGPSLVYPRVMRRALFSADVSDDRIETYARLVQRESPRALAELAGPVVTGRVPTDAPTLVLGVADDAIVPSWAVEATARTYDVDAAFVPRVAHAVMLDTGWTSVAAALREWHDDGEF